MEFLIAYVILMIIFSLLRSFIERLSKPNNTKPSQRSTPLADEDNEYSNLFRELKREFNNSRTGADDVKVTDHRKTKPKRRLEPVNQRQTRSNRNEQLSKQNRDKRKQSQLSSDNQRYATKKRAIDNNRLVEQEFRANDDLQSAAADFYHSVQPVKNKIGKSSDKIARATEHQLERSYQQWNRQKLKEGIVMKEILDKPKALRNKRR